LLSTFLEETVLLNFAPYQKFNKLFFSLWSHGGKGLIHFSKRQSDKTNFNLQRFDIVLLSEKNSIITSPIFWFQYRTTIIFVYGASRLVTQSAIIVSTNSDSWFVCFTNSK